MEYIHKFSIGPVDMDKMLEEYHQLRKTRRYCQACPNFKKYWSCPEYAFDEVLFLKEFKYMYLIAREYEVPREDRQKIFGIQPVADYCTQAMQALKVQSWKNLLELEEEFPGTMALIPGNCPICDISGEGCARPSGQKCRHPEMMRFSLESLGFDVDAICKYEIGVLLLWPKEGHLPEKLCGVMALMSNEKIPMEAIKAHFPDAKKNWLRFSETAPEARNELRPEVKRQESWLDNMRKQNHERAEDPSYKPPKSWIGFKSSVLDSGDYVKNRSWRQEEPETAPDPESVEIVDAMLNPTEVEAPPVPEPMPEATQLTEEQPAPEPSKTEPTPAELTPEEDDSKYKWLGFKRSVEEAEEVMKSRPIPKFNVPEEEEKPEESPTLPEEPAADKPVPEPHVEAEGSEPVPEAPEAPEAVPGIMPEEKHAEPKIKPEPEAETHPEPVHRPMPEPEKLPDRFSVADVLGAAIEIAKDVVGDEFIKQPSEKPVVPEPPQKPTLNPSESPEENDSASEEDDSKYKWLGFKADLSDEDDGFKKGGWKKNY